MENIDTATKQEIIDAAADSIAAMERGTLVPHTVLRTMLKLDEDQMSRYYGMVDMLKRNLISVHQVFVSVVPRKGYLILADDEAHTVPSRRVHLAHKAVGRAIVEYNAIPLAKLTAPVRDKVIQDSQQAGNLFGLMRKALV